MSRVARGQRLATLLALALLCLLPTWLLWPCLLGPRTFVPFDVAMFPPVSTRLEPGQLEALHRTANADPTEVPLVFVPELRFTQQELAEGRLPQWNPYARAGVPLLATSVVGLLYPPNWPTLLLGDPMRGLALNAWLALTIAGLLAFGFLRSLGLKALPSLFGAAVFALSGTLTANLHFYQRVHALIWLPGLLWAVRGISHNVSLARIPALLGLAVSTALTWTAGFAPYAFPSTMLAGLYALALLVRDLRARRSGAALRSAGCMALGFGLGFGMAAVQLLPMFAFFPESNRLPFPSPDSVASQAFAPAGLLGLLLPDAFGHPLATRELPYAGSPLVWSWFRGASWLDGRPFHPNFNFIEYAVFAGSMTVWLALAGLLGQGPRFRRFAAWLLALLLLLALAPALPLPATWRATLPSLNFLPGLASVPPMRFVGPVSLLLAVLAACGLAAAPHGLGRRPWRILIVAALTVAVTCGVLSLWVGARDGQAWLHAIAQEVAERFQPRYPGRTAQDALLVVAPPADTGLPQDAWMDKAQERLAGALRHAAFGSLASAFWFLALAFAGARQGRLNLLRLAAVAATVAELVALARPHNQGRIPHPDTDTAVHAFLREQRTRRAAEGGFTVVRAAPQPVLPLQLPPCTLVPERIRDLNIYTFVDGRSHRLFLALYGQGQMVREFWPLALPDDERLRRPLFDLLGVRYVLSTEPLAHAGALVGPEWRGPGGAFFVHERPSALPRAFVVPKLTTLPDDDAVVARMVAPEFDPRREAFVTPDQPAEHPDPHTGQGAERAPEARRVTFRTDLPDEVVLDVEPGRPGWMVLADSAWSGWECTVNDVATPIARADLFLRAVPVPGQGSEVRFRFTTPRLGLGLRVTMASTALLLLLALLLVTSRHASPATETSS